MDNIPSTTVLLLAGGIGNRMHREMPKQFLPLAGKAVALWSFDIFCQVESVIEIVVVCKPEYETIFLDRIKQQERPLALSFALPGDRRQDSAYNGLQKITQKPNLFAIHDSARPFITVKMVNQVIQSAQEYGAATLGVPTKMTLKEVGSDEFIERTPDRSRIWEVQTPQVIKNEIYQQGFEKATRENITVTDDVSLIELLGKPVKMILGSYTNLKITTPEDLDLAHFFIEKGSFQGVS